MTPVRLALAAAAVGLLALVGCGGDDESATTDTSTTTAVTTTTTATSAPTPDSTAGTADDGGLVIEEDYVGDGPRVAVLGDSLTVQGHEALREALPDRSLRVVAVRGEGFAGGPYSDAFGSSIMLDAAADLGATDPVVAVVALGTNDAWTPDGTLPEALEAMDRIVEDLGDACLVTVLVDSEAPAEDFDTTAAEEINGRLEAVADQVVDWGVVAAEPGVLVSDGIHPTPEGQDRWAEEVATAVEACTA